MSACHSRRPENIDLYCYPRGRPATTVRRPGGGGADVPVNRNPWCHGGRRGTGPLSTMVKTPC